MPILGRRCIELSGLGRLLALTPNQEANTLADIGFINGFRFANLGGRREVFVPVGSTSTVAPWRSL